MARAPTTLQGEVWAGSGQLASLGAGAQNHGASSPQDAPDPGALVTPTTPVRKLRLREGARLPKARKPAAALGIRTPGPRPVAAAWPPEHTRAHRR